MAAPLTVNGQNFEKVAIVDPATGNAASLAVGVGFLPSGKSPLTGTFTAAGQSAAFAPLAGRSFNISLWGTFAATVQLERSFDGATWLPITANGTQLEKFTAPASESWSDDESGVQYRLNCTAFTSGNVNYRVSQ